VTPVRPNAGAPRLLPRSTQGRHTLMAGLFTLVVLTVLGAFAGLAIRGDAAAGVCVAAAVLLGAAGAAGATWFLAGRTPRPVAGIRGRTARMSPNGSPRLPEPPGADEITKLARSSDQTINRLTETMDKQRRFASIVSHELRSPVTALHAQLEEALMYPDQVDPWEAIRTALHATERLQALIDELLVYTRITDGRAAPPEPVDLTALVHEDVALRSHGTPVFVHATEEVVVLGHRTHLMRALSNLIANAQRHAETRVDITVERCGDQAIVVVQDDGAGIAPEDRERVFEPFVRLADGRRRDPGGTGLGLALCRETIKKHRGSVTIEDRPKGARFVVRLPLAAAGRAPRPAQRLSRDPVHS